MRIIGNVLWLVLAGWWLALAYVLFGLLSFVLIVTIPFGIAAFRLAGYVLWPFGRTTRFRRDAGVWSVIGNVLWLVVFGWGLAVGHVVAGALLCLTIIGIPLGIACFKMVPLALLPLGQEVLPAGEAAALDQFGMARA
jgi:uncharacterized membrane protein YccF (DUF307 family)